MIAATITNIPPTTARRTRSIFLLTESNRFSNPSNLASSLAISVLNSVLVRSSLSPPVEDKS